MSVSALRDKAVAQVRLLMGHALLDPDTRREASRETSSSPGAEIELIQQAERIDGAASVFERITHTKVVGGLLDCMIEIRYALVFVSSNFDVQFLPPQSSAKPDLLVSRDNESAYVEIKRIAAPHPHRLPAALQSRSRSDDRLADLLKPYGGDEDAKKIEDELRGKFRQVRAVSGSNSLIATWSDRDFVEEIDFRTAMENIRRSQSDPDDGRRIPDGLLFCIFGSFWMSGKTGQQLYCEQLKNLTEPFLAWAAHLERACP